MMHVVGPIAVAGALPYALTLLSKSKGFGAAENRETRAWQAQLTGWRQRAYWAHLNAFETLPIFMAMAILAHLAQPASVVAAGAAWAFVALRIGYSACYLADVGALRSTVWFASMGAVAVLLLVALDIA